jgi:hypothetical protein
MSSSRVDEHGRAFKGSQRQVQSWVNDAPPELNEAILAELPTLAALAPEITWKSPLEEQEYQEYSDAAFLEQIGLEGLAPQLAEFWPAGGPVWDGLAVYLTPSGEGGVILVEGKSYPGELYSAGCQAGQSGSDASRQSRVKIAAALRRTQTWLEMDEMPDWMGQLYQSANRLAHVYWIRTVAGRDAWLVHLLFENDPHHETTRERWEQELGTIDAQLGLAAPLAWHGNVILQAKP